MKKKENGFYNNVELIGDGNMYKRNKKMNTCNGEGKYQQTKQDPSLKSFFKYRDSLKKN
jgi:hypothetical protein